MVPTPSPGQIISRSLQGTQPLQNQEQLSGQVTKPLSCLDLCPVPCLPLTPALAPAPIPDSYLRRSKLLNSRLPFRNLLRLILQIPPCCFHLAEPGEGEGLPRWLSGKEPAGNAGDLGSIPGLGRSPGGGHGNPLQYSCRDNPMDRGTWQATVRGVAQSWTRWSD